ncbi:hypothetical protein DER45DRAFT_610045 [Fusarium avenaceum]|nr:hypothetical protein DER45DRAFT_610045 [Fusarium avenaceum]
MTSVHTYTNGVSTSVPGDHDDNQSVASDLSTATFKTSFKQDLLKAIENIRSSGTFAFNAELKVLSRDLGISVDGVGAISLPLGESHARHIVSKARQAPYGKGSDTIVDTAVRNTWELDPSQFTITWSGWPSYLRKICNVVAQQMGISTTVHADIYKMLLYEKGAMFKAHTDTEKIPGMFGTLVVSLPSTHTGGEVILKHCGETVIYKSSKSRASCAGWYSDVTHEHPLLVSKDLSCAPLRHCIRRWLAEGSERQSPYAYHVLDHEYTEANTSYAALKGADLARVGALRQACNGLPVTLFLALIEKEEMGDVEFDPCDLQYDYRGAMGEYDDEEDEDDTSYHHISEVYETHHKLKTVRDLEGVVVASEMGIEEDDMLDPDAFEDMVGEEEYEGYMGNSGPSATHWYRLGAVALVPHDSIVDFLDQSGNSYGSSPFPQAQISYLAKQCSRPNVQDYLLTAMIDMFEEALPKLRDDPYLLTDKSVVSNVLKAALRHQRYELVEETLTNLHSTLPLEWYSWLRQWMMKGDREDKAIQRFNRLKKGLTLAMLSSGDLTSKFKIITHLVPLPKDLPPGALPTPRPIMEWTQRMLRKFLGGDGPRQVTKDDGSSIVDMALYFDDPILFLTESVVPVFEKRPLAPGIRFRVLSQLMESINKRMLPTSEGQNLYRTMARLLIASQAFDTLRDARLILKEQNKKKARTPWITTDRAYVLPELNDAITYETLKNFFAFMLEISTELDNLAAQFISKVVIQADKLPRNELFTMWLPFLRSVIPILERNSISLTTPVYQKFFSTLILSVLDKYLGPEPAKPANWSVPGLSCNCGDCQRVTAFLAHPTQMSGRFPMNKERRHHIHNRLDGDHVGCTHQSERNTNPHTLVITKTNRPQELKLQRWLERLDQVVKQLSQFKAEHLATLLGSDVERVKQLGKRQKGQGNLSHRPAVGEKRRADAALDVIDLTSD